MTSHAPRRLRLAAAAAALIVGYFSKSLYGAVGAGAAVMIAGAWLPI